MAIYSKGITRASSWTSTFDSADHFTCDDAGNIASKQVETSGTAATMTTYSHNSLNEVTAIGGTAGPMPVIVRGDTNEPATVEVKSGATGSTWKDARMLAGNRFESDLDLAAGANAIDVRATDGSSNVANYTYSLTLAAATAAAPTYDADGNMISDGVRGYEWDSISKLTKVTWGGSPVKSTEYRYNALGQRSERIEKSGATETAHYYYLYDGIRLLCRYQGGTAATNIDRRYLSQGEQRKISSAWSSYYYNRDHLGSVREVMNADGTLAARYDYTPYGVRRVQYESTAYTGGCDLGFTGHITQPSPAAGQTELVLTHFRGYDPELGRWLSVDPIGEAGGLNLYRYVENEPLLRIDLNGLKPGDPFPSADDAAIDALNFIKPTGKDMTRTERGGLIYKLGKCFYATKPHKGSQGTAGGNGKIRLLDALPSLPQKSQVIAGYHNHYDGLSGDFSPDDKSWAYNHRLHHYVTGSGIHDKGNKRYSPKHKPYLPDDEDPDVIQLPNKTSGKKCK